MQHIPVSLAWWLWSIQSLLYCLCFALFSFACFACHNSASHFSIRQSRITGQRVSASLEFGKVKYLNDVGRLDWAALGQDTRELLVNLTPHILWNHRNCLWDVKIMKRSCITSPPGWFMYKWKCGIPGNSFILSLNVLVSPPAGGLGGCLCNPLVQAGRTPGLLLPPVQVFLVVGGLALFPKLLFSDWWRCKCYESSKETLFKGHFWCKGKTLPISSSSSLWTCRAGLADAPSPSQWPC